MKRITLIILALTLSLWASAQNNGAKADDFGRIVLTAHIDGSKCRIPAGTYNLFKNKMNQIVTQNGIGGSYRQRFIITANVDVLTKDITATAPPMHAYTLEVTFYIGDGVDGTLFSTSSITTKGVGETDEKAYIAALKNIRPSSPAFKEMIDLGKNKIIEYFNANGDIIISKARAYASLDNFDEAIYLLMTIPDLCKDVYEKALAEAGVIYRQKIDVEGAKKLAQAKTIWYAGLDYDAAVSASQLLAQIHPDAACYSQAVALSKEIAKRVKEIDDREWKYILNDQKYAHEESMAQLNAYKEIAVEQARHQPQTEYYILWW